MLDAHAPPARTRRGPKTPEGKARSARNAVRHGLRADRFELLPDEDSEAYLALVETFAEAYRPADPVEDRLVVAMARAQWLLFRCDRLEAELFLAVPPAEPGRGHRTDPSSPARRASLSTLVRYRSRFHATMRRCQRLLSRRRAQAAAASSVRTNELHGAEPLPPVDPGEPVPSRAPAACERDGTNDFARRADRGAARAPTPPRAPRAAVPRADSWGPPPGSAKPAGRSDAARAPPHRRAREAARESSPG